MKLINDNGNEVDFTLKAIHDAVEGTGSISTRGKEIRIVRQDGGESYVVLDYVYTPNESNEYDNIEEAYMRFRFLFEAYYKQSLPSL